jgi:hypothetical protein
MNRFILTVILILTPVGLVFAQIGNEVLGDGAGVSITSGDYNTLIGDNAGNRLSTGLFNTFVGYNTGSNSTSSSDNTFIGYEAGLTNSSGVDNVFVGKSAGRSNDSGGDGVFIGCDAGHNNTTGPDNVFIGEESGYENTTGRDNVFLGEDSGYSNTTADDNTAIGNQALRTNQTGSRNTAVGNEAGWDILNATRNTVVGNAAGVDIGEGNCNTMLGDNAGANTEYADFNTFIGTQSGHDNNRTAVTNNANRNTALGAFSGWVNREGEDNVWIGMFADSGSWIGSFSHDTLVTDMQSSTSWNPPLSFSSTGSDNAIYRTTVVGGFASAGEDDSVSIGYNCRSDNVNSIAIGSGASGTGTRDITIGASASSTHTDAIVIGYGATSHGDDIAVIGNNDTLGWHPNADATTSLGATNYRFTVAHVQDVSVVANTGSGAEITLSADDREDNDDTWKVSAADSGALTVESFATGSYAALMTVTTNGDVTVAGDITVNSDARLKQNIRPIHNALTLLGHIDGTTYEWKPGTGRAAGRRYGLVAQEIEGTVPELVSTAADGEIKSVNYQGFVPILINAVKELEARNAAQVEAMALMKQQVDILEQQIATLKRP